MASDARYFIVCTFSSIVFHYIAWIRMGPEAANIYGHMQIDP